MLNSGAFDFLPSRCINQNIDFKKKSLLFLENPEGTRVIAGAANMGCGREPGIKPV
jgi:hypothetical protein